jgi:hypothetical protein
MNGLPTRIKVCSVVLIIFAAALLFDCSSLVGFGDKTWQGSDSPPATKTRLLNDEQQKYVLAAYENAVKEIQTRLDQESHLFVLNFTIVGAILAFLFRTPQKGDPARLLVSARNVCFVWGAVVTSAIIDTRIQFHQSMMSILGLWIKEQVEPIMAGTGIIQWETYLRQQDSLMSANIYPLLRLDTNLLTFILFSGIVYVSLESIRHRAAGGGAPLVDIEATICRYSFWGSVASLFVFFLVSIHFHPRQSVWIAFYFCEFLAGCAVAWIIWRPEAREQQ